MRWLVINFTFGLGRWNWIKKRVSRRINTGVLFYVHFFLLFYIYPPMLDIGIFQFFIMIDQVYENLKELAPPQQDKPISLKLLEASKSSNLTIEKEPKKLIDFREGTKDMDKVFFMHALKLFRSYYLFISFKHDIRFMCVFFWKKNHQLIN